MRKKTLRFWTGKELTPYLNHNSKTLWILNRRKYQRTMTTRKKIRKREEEEVAEEDTRAYLQEKLSRSLFVKCLTTLLLKSLVNSLRTKTCSNPKEHQLKNRQPSLLMSMLHAMGVVSHLSLELGTSALYARTLITVRFVRTDLAMNILSLRSMTLNKLQHSWQL